MKNNLVSVAIAFAIGAMVFAGCKQNQQPDKPVTPSGFSTGSINIVYTFIGFSADPDGDSIAIRFSWGDGDTSVWSHWGISGDSFSMSYAYQDTGLFLIKAQAKDIKGATSNWSDAHSIQIVSNQPPATPAAPSGPSTGRRDSTYEFTTITADPENNTVSYRFDWGDGDTSTWTAWLPSGSSCARTHTWSRAGTYQVRAQAKDVKECFSPWSSSHQIVIVNTPPQAPFYPNGPDSGIVNVHYYFSTLASDPDNDSISIRFSWGDGDTSGWSSLVAAGETVKISHSWSNPGAYYVKAQAKDEQESTSYWSADFPIVITLGWAKTFGGSGDDTGYAAQQTADGGYIIAGTTLSFGAGFNDVYLVKTDESGNKQWQATFGGYDLDECYSAQQTSDGGYILVGQTTSFGSGYQVYLVKADASGNQQWSQVFGIGFFCVGRSVQQTADGGYIITGYAQGLGLDDAILIKVEGRNGNLQWQKILGGSSSDAGYSVQQTSDGGYIIAGRTGSFGSGGWDVYLIKTDGNGDEQWHKTFGGTAHETGYSVQQTADGGYIIAGTTSSFGAGLNDVYLIKTDLNGNEQWHKTFGGTADDGGYSVQQTSDGGFILTGYSYSFGGGGWDVCLIKTDRNGNEQWHKTFGGAYYNCGYSVRQTTDGGYIIGGYFWSSGTGSDCYLIKTDASGNTLNIINRK